MKFSTAMLPLARDSWRRLRQPEAPAYGDVRPVRSIVVGTSSGSVGATYSGEVLACYEQTGVPDLGAHRRAPGRGGQPRQARPAPAASRPAQETLQVVAATADVEAAKARVAQRPYRSAAHRAAAEQEIRLPGGEVDQQSGWPWTSRNRSSSRPSPSSRIPCQKARLAPTCGPTTTAGHRHQRRDRAGGRRQPAGDYRRRRREREVKISI